MRQHCAQCLTEVFTSGYQTPTGETLCASCYFALWGPRSNGNRLASTEARRPRSLRPKRGRSIWIPGPTAELDPAGGGPPRGRWHR